MAKVKQKYFINCSGDVHLGTKPMHMAYQNLCTGDPLMVRCVWNEYETDPITGQENHLTMRRDFDMHHGDAVFAPYNLDIQVCILGRKPTNNKHRK